MCWNHTRHLHQQPNIIQTHSRKGVVTGYVQEHHMVMVVTQTYSSLGLNSIMVSWVSREGHWEMRSHTSSLENPLPVSRSTLLWTSQLGWRKFGTERTWRRTKTKCKLLVATKWKLLYCSVGQLCVKIKRSVIWRHISVHTHNYVAIIYTVANRMI